MPNTVDLSNKLGESEFDGQYEQGVNLIEELTQDIELKTQPIQEENIEKLFFQKLPLINRLAKMMDKTGLGASKAAYYFSQSAGSLKAARSLQITGAVIAGIDFFTIPLAFLAYKIAGKPFPYSFSKGVKFVYSMVILSLAITAFFVSPAVAAFLPLITVSLGLGSAIINLVKHSSSKWFLNKDEKLCLQEIQDLTNQLQQFKTVVVPKRLSELSPLKQQNALKYNAEVSGLCLQQKLLVSQLQTKLNRLEVIKHRQHKVGTRHTVDKTTGFGLSCAALAGIICLIIAPPIGMILLAGTLATSITYVVGRGIFEVIKPLPKKNTPTAVKISYSKSEHAAELTPNLSNNSLTLGDSTLLTAKLMSGPNSAKQFLSSLNQQAHDINEIRSKAINVIDHIITDGDERLALEFLSQVGQALEQANYQPIEIKNFITGLPRFKQASKTFERALDNLVADKHPSFNQEKLLNLKRIPQVNVYLEQHQIKAHKTPLSLEQLFELPHNELPSLSVA